MHLTDRFSEAASLAASLHQSQNRKGTQIPYVAHLFAVAAKVLEWGGDEDTAIAALLHDAVEDQGGLETAALIRDRFGERVEALVLACSDSTVSGGAKPPWRERKETYVAHLRSAELDLALIAAADKLHNLTAMVNDLRREGPGTLRRFTGAPAEQVWYFSAIVEALEPHAAALPLDELRERIEDFRRLAFIDETRAAA